MFYGVSIARPISIQLERDAIVGTQGMLVDTNPKLVTCWNQLCMYHQLAQTRPVRDCMHACLVPSPVWWTGVGGGSIPLICSRSLFIAHWLMTPLDLAPISLSLSLSLLMSEIRNQDVATGTIISLSWSCRLCHIHAEVSWIHYL